MYSSQHVSHILTASGITDARCAPNATASLACRGEFEAAWHKAAASTDWQQLAQDSQHQSDDQVGHLLVQTDLCHAAQTCYFDEDCNVAQSFPAEAVMHFVTEQAAAGLEPSAMQLMEGAFARGKLTALSTVRVILV